MYKKSWFYLLVVLIFCFELSIAQDTEFPLLTGDYIGQTPPGLSPEKFAPGIVSLPDSGELNASFTPDGNEFYFTRRIKGIGYVIRVMRRVNNIWQPPEVAPFSGEYPDVDMCISYDGYRLFFSSVRPIPGTDQPTEAMFIWYMVREADGWGEPQFAGFPINSAGRSIHPSITYNGTLYFQSHREANFGGDNNADIYRAPFVNGGYPSVENIGSPVNSTHNEYDLVVAPDESYIIVSCNDRPDNRGNGDLYISFRMHDGLWSEMINMGEDFNTEGFEGCPMLSPDKKYFFYTSNRDIYWVDSQVLDTYKPVELK